MSIYLGLMSGTSMDGIDAALVDVATHTLLAGITRPYKKSTRQALVEMIAEETVSLESFCQLHRTIGEEFTLAALEVIQKANIKKKYIGAIGNHGQTILHNTQINPSYTLQIGCSHTIAERTQITVVDDFRTRDIILGGQGAPLAPLYHQEIFGHLPQKKVIINIGGISNMTFFAQENAYGFDTGPGNCLMDAWILRCKGESFDKNGSWAASGKVIETLLQNLLEDPYFCQQPPKSIGKEYFSLSWLANFLEGKNYREEDVQATLLALTVHSLKIAIESLSEPVEEVIFCGGGAHNLFLNEMLQVCLPKCKVNTCEYYGVSADFLEAMMFAWLAAKTMANEKVNCTNITGSSKSSLLGRIYPI